MLRQQLAQASLEASDSSGGAGVSRSPNTANMSAPKPLSGRLLSPNLTRCIPGTVRNVPFLPLACR